MRLFFTSETSRVIRVNLVLWDCFDSKNQGVFVCFCFRFLEVFEVVQSLGMNWSILSCRLINGITATRSHWPITFSLVTGWNHVLGQVGCRASWCDSKIRILKSFYCKKLKIWGHWNLENYFYIVSSIGFLCNSRCPFEIMGMSLSRIAYMSLGVVSQRHNRHFKSGRQENSGHMAQGRLRACEGEV